MKFKNKLNYLNVTFNPDDLVNSEVWWIKGYWDTITELWKEMKGTELKVLTKENIMEFLELNMKTIYFSLGDKNVPTV